MAESVTVFRKEISGAISFPRCVADLAIVKFQNKSLAIDEECWSGGGRWADGGEGVHDVRRV